MTLPQRDFDNMGSGDMTLPELKLIQNTGGEMAKDLGAALGDLYLTVMDSIIKGNIGIDIAVIDIHKTRTYWGRADIDNDPPECASPNADSYQSFNGGDCKKCPYRCDAAWLVKAAERREKCTISYNIVAINLEDHMPVMIRAGGISTQPVRELITLLRLHPQIKGKDLHKAKIHVTSQKEKTPSGDAFRYRFAKPTLIQGKEADEVLALTRALLTNVAMLEAPKEDLGAEKLAEPAPISVEPVQMKKPSEPIVDDSDLGF